jgi:hypothetical protein
MRLFGHLVWRVLRPLSDLSRRDNRTQPGVLAPGIERKTSRPEGASEQVPQDGAEFAQTKHRSKMSYAHSGGIGWANLLGLKPQAESYSPFGT